MSAQSGGNKRPNREARTAKGRRWILQKQEPPDIAVDRTIVPAKVSDGAAIDEMVARVQTTYESSGLEAAEASYTSTGVVPEGFELVMGPAPGPFNGTWLVPIRPKQEAN